MNTKAQSSRRLLATVSTLFTTRFRGWHKYTLCVVLVGFVAGVGNAAAESALFFRREAPAKPPAANDAKEFPGFLEKAVAWRTLPVKPPLPDGVQRCRVLAEDAFKNQEFDKALKYYRAGLAIEPLWPEGMLNAAWLAEDLKEYSWAAIYMKHFLELLPDDKDAAKLREQMYLWEGKTDEGPGEGGGGPTTSMSVEEEYRRRNTPSATGCFIATAAFGSPLEAHVMKLRQFRDEVLLKSESGTRFVSFYYEHSPTWAAFIEARPAARFAVRQMLRPVIWYAGARLGNTSDLVSLVTFCSFLIAALLLRKRLFGRWTRLVTSPLWQSYARWSMMLVFAAFLVVATTTGCVTFRAPEMVQRPEVSAEEAKEELASCLSHTMNITEQQKSHALIVFSRYSWAVTKLQLEVFAGTTYVEWVNKADGKLYWLEFNSSDYAMRCLTAIQALRYWTYSTSPEALAELESAWKQFEKKAETWRTLPKKPPLPEGVQRCRVLAEDAFKNQEFDKALKYYRAGLAIEPLWPEGMLNAAWLAEDLKEYSWAAIYMKHFLELLPDDKDAAKLREQMYLWEGKAKE